jgi:CHAT domain
MSMFSNDMVYSTKDVLDLGFMFSSPLFFVSRDENKKVIEHQLSELSFTTETQLLIAAAKESNKSFKFLRSVATQACFTEMLIRKPRALHICCHGITNNESTFTSSEFTSYKDEGDFLLFEKSDGSGELVSSKRLKKLVKGQGVHFELVFLAVCNSESIGEIF